MNTERSPEAFFDDLLALTAHQFKESPVYQKQLKAPKQWYYSVCATPIVKHRGIIFGINWGGSDGQPQTQMPTGNDISEYHFIKRSRDHLLQLGLDFKNNNFNYTNLCFFRTPRENKLVFDDYKQSLPLFERFVNYIDPPWLLSIGSTNMKMLEQLVVLTNIKYFFDNKNKFSGQSARVWGYKIFSVPHPNARMSNEARNTIWEKVINEMITEKCLLK